MKRLIASVGLLLLVALYLWSCEKDDICTGDTPTTPSLLINFYNKDNAEAPKTVTGFKYFVEGDPKVITIDGSVSSIRVPLKVDATSTKWGFILSTSTNNVTRTNTDFLEFKYTTQQTYVSRACGYKTTFLLDESVGSNRNPTLSNGTTPTDETYWINSYSVERDSVDIENIERPNVKIFF
jgi:hypothetical protein